MGKKVADNKIMFSATSNCTVTLWEKRGGLKPCVLVSGRTELIFFLVAGIVLCFGFSRKIMLITH